MIDFFLKSNMITSGAVPPKAYEIMIAILALFIFFSSGVVFGFKKFYKPTLIKIVLTLCLLAIIGIPIYVHYYHACPPFDVGSETFLFLYKAWESVNLLPPLLSENCFRLGEINSKIIWTYLLSEIVIIYVIICSICILCLRILRSHRN